MMDPDIADLVAEIVVAQLADPLPSRTLPDGRMLYVQPLLFGRGQLGISKDDMYDGGFEDVWDYPTLQGAIDAQQSWNPAEEAEPFGWCRHPASGRYNREGEAT